MIDMNKKYQTRDGRPVRILCVDGPDSRWPVIGIPSGQHIACYWMIDGRNYYGAESSDLIPVPEEVTLWVNVYRGRYGNNFYTVGNCSFKTEFDARETGGIDPGYIATVPITFKVPS